MSWTEEQIEQAIAMYTEGNPTPENSVELVKEIAEELGQSANAVRLMLNQKKVYVKKAETKSTTKTKSGDKEDAPKRVSKDSQLAALREAIEAKNGEIDEEILSKLTGKAAAYFTKVLTA
jgi:hypothetical protein